MRPPTLCTLLALTLLASGASAIYEDQAGQYDWLKQNVGRVSLAQLAPRPRPRLVVASEAGVVAALSPRDGTLLWRRVLPEGRGAPTYLELAGNRVLTLSDGGCLLEAMDIDSGRLLWALELWATEEETLGAAPGVALLGAGVGARVAVALGSSLRVFAVDSGRQLGSDELAAGAAQTVLAAEGGQAWAASLLGSGGLAVAAIAPDGSVAQRVRLGSPAALRADGLAISSAGVAALSADGTQLCSGGVSGDGTLACRPLADLLPSGASAMGAALRGGPAGHLVLQMDGGAALLQLAGGHAKLIHFAPGGTASAPAPTESDGEAVLGLATPSPQGLRLAVLSAADGSELTAGVVAGLQPTRVDGSLVGVDRLFLARWKKADGATLR